MDHLHRDRVSSQTMSNTSISPGRGIKNEEAAAKKGRSNRKTDLCIGTDCHSLRKTL